MLWIMLVVGIIVALAFFVITLLELFSSYKDWSEVGSCAIKMVIGLAIAAVGLFGLGGIESLSYTEEPIQTAEWELVSIQDNSEISGNASGGLFYVHLNIDTDEVYSFYYKLDNGGFMRGKVDADDTVIFEKDNCFPKVIQYTTYTKSKMNKFLRAILSFGYGESSHTSYEIYAPTGTILRTYSLDAQ